MLRPALPVALSLALALPARAQTTYDTIFQLKGLAPRADHVATVHGLAELERSLVFAPGAEVVAGNTGASDGRLVHAARETRAARAQSPRVGARRGEQGIVAPLNSLTLPPGSSSITPFRKRTSVRYRAREGVAQSVHVLQRGSAVNEMVKLAVPAAVDALGHRRHARPAL